MAQAEYQRLWYLKNRKAKLARNKAWRQANKNRMDFLTARWYKKNRKQHCKNTSAARILRKEKDPAKFLEVERKRQEVWRNENRERWNRLSKKWRAKNPKRYKELARRHLYGLEPEQFDFLMISQKKKCAICRTKFSTKSPHVDHCHKTGKVRGLLCRYCNQGLGFFRDSRFRLKRALMYL